MGGKTVALIRDRESRLRNFQVPDVNESHQPQRAVLITGAAGGLGRALVNEFAAHGWSVAAAQHRTPVPSGSERIWPVQLDVTDRVQVESAVSRMFAHFGRVDVLINNAGVTADGLVSQMTDEEWDRVIDVNLKGAFLCAKAVIRLMLKQYDGHIINVASFSARSGPTGQANYAASKAGLIGLTQSLAKEAGSRNVRVNAVLPGFLRTGMTEGLSPALLEIAASANALGRLNEVEEVAGLIRVLADTRNVSGQVLQFDSRIAPWT